MVLVHPFALADMLCDRADRPRPRRWDPFPVRSGNVVKVTEKGMPSPSLERLVEEIEVLVERCTRHEPLDVTRTKCGRLANSEEVRIGGWHRRAPFEVCCEMASFLEKKDFAKLAH